MEIKKPKPNLFLYWAACSVNLLSINAASMFSWSSPSIPLLTSNDTNINPLGLPITSFEESMIASLGTGGAVAGTIIAGFVAEKTGRKMTLIIFSMPFFFGHLVIAFAQQIVFFYLIRFIIGLSSGCVFSILPCYVAEISEDTNRGSVGTIFGIMCSLGHLLTFSIGPLMSMRNFAFVLMVPVTIFFIIFIPFVPESPYHFLARDETNQAKKSLKKLRPNSDIEKEFYYLTSVVKLTKESRVSLKDITSSVATRRGLLVCCGLLLFQQSLGIGVVLLYMQPILEAGGNIFPSFWASILIGAIQVVSCCLATLVIDRAGRKILLHISSAGCSLSLFALGTFYLLKEYNYSTDGIFWLPVTSLIGYFIFYNVGYGIIPWSICGEVFATNVKSVCVSFASCLCLITSFIVSACFPFVRDAFGIGGVLYIFSALGTLASVFVVIFVPETKGKSFQEIEYELNNKHKIEDNLPEYDSS